MHNTLKIREMYNKRAKIYDNVLRKLRYHSTIETILSTIPLKLLNKPKILDLGCGTGLATRILFKKFPNSNIVGMDFSEAMLTLYKRRFPKAKAIIGDFNKQTGFYSFSSDKNIKLSKKSFDLIVSSGAVSEYGEKDRVVQFVYNLLKEEGIFVNIGIRNNVMSFITGRLWKYKPIGKNNLINACRIIGFSRIDLVRLSWSHFPSNITKFVLKAIK